MHCTEYQSRCSLYPQGDGTGKRAAVGGRIPPVAGRKFLMMGTATATGRTFEVAVPTLRRDEARDGREKNCGL
ncbi:MAG: hypothetical protein C7B46_09125 [Sulfobacillus benefaciens]|uniref:Uncharacterized protein n=1 Tax=Sulfobacillus benefaciens TaxID=453960 RepID=A0A2T2XGX7_9FIRM|nr:MAG: hypothetical protein C7B46_09125 [Sulfobacillus benefaciens]